MSLYLTPEQKEAGQKHFAEAVNRNAVTRRDFMKGLLAAGAASAVVTPAVYFGYKALEGNPVRAGLIGAGDEGGVLAGFHNPSYLQFIAYSDIRPYNQKRIFEGQAGTPRKGFNAIYGTEAARIKSYPNYKDLLADPNIEAVVIALPLHLHAPVAIEAMKAGKHVLCEKLMAWNVAACKQMIDTAEKTNRVLTIGHQRHYSLLYAHAVEVLRAGELGSIRHIRALWHRNNAWPKLDAEGQVITDEHGIVYHDGWHPPVPEEDRKALEGRIKEAGYKSMEELVRWRLFNRTGAGLMAELGSHQLDACSIFLGKVHPLAVQGVGGKFFYRDERESDDHVFVTFEFPGPNYWDKDKDGHPTDKVHDAEDRVVVTYSSINTNTFEPYGECVMGNQATLVVEKEESIMLYPERDPNKKAGDRATGATVTTAGGGKAAVESSGSTGALGPAISVPGTAGTGPVSRGYTEEMEHFAYCVRMHQKAKDKEEQEKWRLTPRCHGKVAMADAIIALTANRAMRQRERVPFKEAWFDPNSPDVPDKDMVPTDANGKEIA
jgi:predicted dehydrogenase